VKVDQISLPFRIALVGILVVGALYLVVLKPKDPVPAAPPAATLAATAPGVNGLGNAVDKARTASATQTSSDAATQAATGGGTPAATSTTPAPAISKATGTNAPSTPTAKPEPAADPSASILAGLDRGDAAVVLFSGPKASDDRAVRRAVDAVARRSGKVTVHTVPIAQVGAYETITRGVSVLQAPTILVIGSERTARTIVGFTTTAEIDQLVADVRRSR